MEKEAASLGLLFGVGQPDGLPRLSSDSDVNTVAWRSAGLTATLSATLIGLKLAANAIAKKELEKSRKRAHENKVNAMFAYSTPNTAPQVEAVGKVRGLGVTKDASGVEKEGSWETAPLTTALPFILSVPASLAISKVVANKVENEEKEEVDEKLAEARNKLDALHAKLLKLRMKKSASALDLPSLGDNPSDEELEELENKELEDAENAALEGSSDDEEELRSRPQNKRKASDGVNKKADGGIWGGVGGGYLLIAALTAGLAGATVYNMTKSQDKARKKKKLMEKQIFAQNLTNTPNQVELLLGKHNPFPTDESRQSYIQEISKAVD